MKCIICHTNKGEVRDRNTPTDKRKKICGNCHSKRLQNDFKIILNPPKKLEEIKRVLERAEAWCKDQNNGLTDGEICISALKDIKRIIKKD